MTSEDNDPNNEAALGGGEAQSAAEPYAAAAARDAEDRIAALEAENAGLKDQVLRAMAEAENTRRRLETQSEDRARYAIGNFAKDMLNVADNLRRALDSVPPGQRETNDLTNTLMVGVEMTERTLLTAMERYGVKPIAAMGARFDANFHQAMMEMEDPSKPSGTVVMVMQTGYTIHDRLLRPAMVGVSKGGPKPGINDAAPAPSPEPEAPGHIDTSA